MARGGGDALPPMSGLSLRAAPARTDEFYALSMDEARQLNEDGGDPLTGEDYPRGREANEEGATFRVTTRGADGRPHHQYYDAARLWQWASRSRTDPLRNPWVREDWMALRNRYEPEFPVPAWVQDPGRRAAVQAWVTRQTRNDDPEREWVDLFMLVPGAPEDLDNFVESLENNATAAVRVRFAQRMAAMLDNEVDDMWEVSEGMDLAYNVMLNGTPEEVDAGLDLLAAFAFYHRGAVDHRIGYEYAGKIPVLKRFLQEGTPGQKKQAVAVFWGLMTESAAEAQVLYERHYDQLPYGRALFENNVNDELARLAKVPDMDSNARSMCIETLNAMVVHLALGR